MKKSLLLGILGLTTGVASSYGQGIITLDNYNSAGGDGGPLVTYGLNVPLNGVSGTAGSGGLNGSWTVGLYFVVGTPSISDPSGNGIPNGALALGTGPGSSAPFYTSTFSHFGEFQALNNFQVSASGAPPTVTVEIVAYDTAGGTYANAQYRGHSAPFTMASAATTSTSPPLVGDFMSGFSVTSVPEPASLALAGLGGLASLVMLRRKQA